LSEMLSIFRCGMEGVGCGTISYPTNADIRM
jgi:hypothetical protein